MTDLSHLPNTAEPTSPRPLFRSLTSLRTQKRVIPFLFLIAPVSLLLVFTYIPVGSMFYYSLLEWNGFSKDQSFVGLEN